MSESLVAKVYCPRCDREYKGRTKAQAFVKLKEHMRRTHRGYESDVTED